MPSEAARNRSKRHLTVERRTLESLRAKGRPFYPEDVQSLLGKDDAGKWRYSLWWITHRFALESKKRTGGRVWWWELDVYEYLDSQRLA